MCVLPPPLMPIAPPHVITFLSPRTTSPVQQMKHLDDLGFRVRSRKERRYSRDTFAAHGSWQDKVNRWSSGKGDSRRSKASRAYERDTMDRAYRDARARLHDRMVRSFFK